MLRIAAMLVAFSSLADVVAKAATPREYSVYDAQISELLSEMTLAEKIGQMTQAELSALGDLKEIESLALGSVFSGGGSDPAAGNSLEAWTDAYDACQRQALATRLQIPLLYGVDALHGHNNVLGAVIFPHHIGLGCTRDADLVKTIGEITALEVRATGINWTFAPCVTVPQDDRWGRTYEGFSENPELVALLGAAEVAGLQGNSLGDPRRVLACAKHFLGDGGTSPVLAQPDWPGFDKPRKLFDRGDVLCDETELREIHLAPYLPAVQLGVGSIMPSYSSWREVKCSANEYLLMDILRGEIGFEGFTVSDYDAIDEVDDDYKVAIQKSINAGIDMVMVPTKYATFVKLLTELVESGQVPRSRIDDAVTRILRVKAAMGLLDPHGKHLADRTLHEQFGSREHREVAREAVRKSLVLLKNEHGTLPLAKNLKFINVTGRGADNLGMQCGGWTIDWQGTNGEVTTGGTTLLEGLRQVAGPDVKVTHNSSSEVGEAADVAIVVIGEEPYAEGLGDDFDLEVSEEDLQAVRQAKKANVPVVVILLSGRPLIINDILEQADAVIAAWLPGTEGGGMADVLFGDFAPTGKLSFSWPRAVEQHPLNHGNEGYDPLFEYGYGLTY